MGFLLLIMAFAMAVATFVEGSYGTAAARGLVYNAWWFELILALLGINLIVNYFRSKLYSKYRFTVGLFHISFVVIVLGAAITRYISFEGIMHIREGEASHSILSTDDYITIEYEGKKIQKKVLFSEFKTGELNTRISIGEQEVKLKSVGFVKDAKKTPVDYPTGTGMIDFVISAGQGMESFVFRKNDHVDLGGFVVAYDDTSSNIRFFNQEDKLFLQSDLPLQLRSMTGGEPEDLPVNEPVEVQPMHLYSFDGYMLLVKKFYEKAILRVTHDPSGNAREDAVLVEVSDGQTKTIVNVFGRHNMAGEPTVFKLGHSDVKISYGAVPIELPFALKLRDFQLERYPGSESPSSFASELTLLDQEKGIERDIRVFMNNTLKHRGYRFYQSSYDQDERGTVLSVNVDGLGTAVSYLGYGMLFLGIILSLLNKNSYFSLLIRRLKQNSKVVAVILTLLLLGSSSLKANKADLANIPALDPLLVKDFSELWVHGHDGRIEPVSTLASEVLRKISRKSSFEGKPAEEVMLSMYLFPDLWKTVPMVKVSDKQIQAQLGTTKDQLPVTHFFDEAGNYRIAQQVQAAHAKMPAFRNHLDKEYIYVDERVNVCFMVFRGQLLNVFPTGKFEEPWLSPGSKAIALPVADSLFVNRGFELLKESVSGKEAVDARQIIATVAAFQEKFATGLLPSEAHKKAEIFYNKFNPFKRVFPVYLLFGITLLFALFVNIFRQKNISRILKNILVGFIVLGFVIHTGGLALRWYASGHAPWSNGYESMIYVAWATMLAGLIFGRKYPLVIGTAAFLSGITLFVAHLNWMNPEITHLVPVLKSYWLLIHVAVITASYGFIGLSAFLSILVLTLFCIVNEKNRNNVARFVDQLTTISEMSVIVGLYMLTIGTFLGGIWANESWGRYWGWDPKETWSLITIVLYSFIAHMRLIPSIRGVYNYNFASVIGFASVLMTYFGVNYYLSGLHSYGRGTAGAVHWSVYLSIGIIAVLMVISYLKSKKYKLDV
jgi:cytochrome c-type biogenesis protein CcsB